jgi:tetratricopeptide (TPR) repeat protein
VQFLPWLVLAGLLAWLWNRRDGWGRPALLGIGFFLVNLVPFAGFVTGSYMAFSWVTDHTLYLPIIGLVGLAVAGLERLGGKLTPPARRLEFGAVALVLVLLATASHGYAQLYVSKKVLCEYAVARNPYAVPAQVALGAMALDESRVDEAIRHAEAAVDCDPVSSNAQVVLGCAYLRQGRIADAEAAFKKAVDLAPTDPGARTNLGEAMAKEGRFEDAIRQFDLVLRSHPAQADALAARGEARRCLGIYPGAWADLKEAVSLDPDAAQARISLGVLELARGELHPAIDDLRRARELAPVDPNADYAALWIWTARQKLGERADADRELGDSLDHHWNAKPDGFATKHAELLLGRIDAMDYSTTFSRSSSGWIESFYYTGVKLLVTPKIESIPQDTEKSGTTASAFLRVIRTAPPTFFEYTLALGELNQINWQ